MGVVSAEGRGQLAECALARARNRRGRETAIMKRVQSLSKAEVDFFSTSFKVPFPASSYAHLQHQSERDVGKALLTVMI